MNTTRQVASRQRLVVERLRRHWTQLEVADQLGTTPGNVSRWERGITSPGPYFRSRLCEVFGRSALELGLGRDASDEVLRPHAQASVLFQRGTSARSSPFYTGHEHLPTPVQALIRTDTVALSSVSANSGQGELNLPEQESIEQAWLAQTVAWYLQELMLDNMEAVVLVVLDSNVS